MALSIRNPYAEQLARQVASLTNENITQTIIKALENRMESLKGKKTIVDVEQQIISISQRCNALPDMDDRNDEEIMNYNENGVWG
ncbi:MAG: type II toxin-antitoxin system VapB family antitoxin [Thermodesulfobacteriota bacterium]|nr:type II toxin-antitoxin system VapB family antitoxin [Thermodesulfobacteriota bacterium]